MAETPDPDILEAVQTLVRRDLKLPAGEPLPAEAPLFGGDLDLDSLDMLLLLTSVEREFGVRIASQEVGREAFQSVASLARYIETHRAAPASAGASSAASAPPPTMNPIDRLPHGPAFRFVSRVSAVQPGDSAVGVWALDGTEPFFAGHFPGNPIVPGVLIVEALAQLAGIAGAGPGIEAGMIAHVDVRFTRPVAPPAEIELSARLTSALGQLRVFEVAARVGDAVVAEGAITLAIS